MSTCPYKCNSDVLKKDLDSHKKSCNFQEQECKCGLVMKQKDLDAHKLSECPEVEVSCEKCTKVEKKKNTAEKDWDL